MIFTNVFYLIQAGNAADALQECENLNKEGLDLDFAIYLLGFFNLIVLYIIQLLGLNVN